MRMPFDISRLSAPAIDPEWQPIQTCPEGVLVETKIDDVHGCRNEQTLIRQGGLFFTPSRDSYVYYTPTHWRAKQAELA